MKSTISILMIVGLLVSASENFSLAAEASADTSVNNFDYKFWSINRYASSTTDFDEVDDARNFTSEALFSESLSRLTRQLTDDELRNIIRIKEPKETFNNLRLSFGAAKDSQTDIDLFYKNKGIEDAQITDLYHPNDFNNVSLQEYGIAAQRWFYANQIFLRGSYSFSEREGVIEFLPDDKENINNYELDAAIKIPASAEGNTVTLYPSYLFQDIEQDIPNGSDRERSIFSLGLSYGNEAPANALSDPRPAFSSETILERRFDPRGFLCYGGYILDNEPFGDVDVVKQDIYIGKSFNVRGKSFDVGSVDIAVQPTIFTSDAEHDSTQDNAQYRTDVTVFYQYDYTILLMMPFRHDIAIDGPDDFDNWKIGAEVRYGGNLSSVTNNYLPVDWSVSARYDHQDFYQIDKKLNMIGIYFKIGL